MTKQLFIEPTCGPKGVFNFTVTTHRRGRTMLGAGQKPKLSIEGNAGRRPPSYIFQTERPIVDEPTSPFPQRSVQSTGG